MMDKYEAEDRGIKIIELENAFQLCTKQEYYENLIKVASQPRKYALSDVLLCGFCTSRNCRANRAKYQSGLPNSRFAAALFHKTFRPFCMRYSALAVSYCGCLTVVFIRVIRILSTCITSYTQ